MCHIHLSHTREQCQCVQKQLRALVRFGSTALVDLERPVNNLVEPKGAEEADTTAKQSKAQTNHEHVGQVNDHGQKAHQFQPTGQEPQRVGK